jgi:imidazolonepropionase-like amidohydrolase
MTREGVVNNSSARTLLIQGGMLRNPFPPYEICRADILIVNDQIIRVAEQIDEPAAQVIHADDKIIIPGLINLHVHITRRHLHLQPLGVPFRLGAPEIENSPDEIRILWALRNAWTELAEGVTTVRDAGSKHHVSIRLRDALRQGIFPGPQIIASGEPLAMTGGHESHRYAGAREADGPAEVRKAAREQLREGADWIKLMASAGIGGMPYREHPSFTEFTLEELTAGVSEAHKRGRRAMAHAMSDESVRFCIEAGMDTVEHGVLMNEDTISALKAADIGFVPTISGIANVYARENAAGNRSFANRLLEEVLKPHRAVVAEAIKQGVQFGTGSDTLGSVADELSLFVECGMSKESAFSAATIDAASMLGMEDAIGSIEPGKRADLVLLASDPIEDVEAYKQVREVVFGGRLLSETYPEALRITG